MLPKVIIVDKSLTLNISKLSNAKFGIMLPKAGTLGGLPSSVALKKSVIRL
jgi:hypothetical protein